MKTTVGQLLVNDALPEDMRDYTRVLNAKSIKGVLLDVANKYPEQYRDIVKRLSDIGKDVSYYEGSSISLNMLKPAKAKQLVIPQLRLRVEQINDDAKMSREDKDKLIIEETQKLVGKLDEAIHQEGLADGNVLSSYADAGARGDKGQINQMRGASLITTDHRGRAIPIPITNSFAEGLDPVELWAGSYGVRSGFTDVKLATPKAGYFGKQLANASHKLIVTGNRPMEGTGLPVNADDPDNDGAVLARDYGPYKAGTIITPRIRKDLAETNSKLIIHSPIASVTPGGIAQWAVGVREKTGLTAIGENVGISAAQAVNEPLAQAAISSKHSAGVVGGGGGKSSAATRNVFGVVNEMANIPKEYDNQAAVADADGSISKIEDAPQGGKYVFIGDVRHYVPAHQDPSVKVGQVVEAGDVLSDGVPNPAHVVQYKGIGEGRRYFMEKLYSVLRNSGVKVQRRNVELLTRGLINHVRMTGEAHGRLPDDIVEYDEFASTYAPRPGSYSSKPNLVKNKYLEAPTLHYSIGTRITPRVMDTLKEHNVNEVMVHDDEPEFQPEMQRAMDIMNIDPDWKTRLGGFYLQKNFLDAVHRGGKSSDHGLSYVPALAKGVDFGKTPKPGY